MKVKLDALYSRHRTRVDGVLGLGLARLQREATPPTRDGELVRLLCCGSVKGTAGFCPDSGRRL